MLVAAFARARRLQHIALQRGSEEACIHSTSAVETSDRSKLQCKRSKQANSSQSALIWPNPARKVEDELTACSRPRAHIQAAETARTSRSHDSRHPFINVVAFGSSAAVAGRVQANLCQLFLDAFGAGGQLATLHGLARTASKPLSASEQSSTAESRAPSEHRSGDVQFRRGKTCCQLVQALAALAAKARTSTEHPETEFRLQRAPAALLQITASSATLMVVRERELCPGQIVLRS